LRLNFVISTSLVCLSLWITPVNAFANSGSFEIKIESTDAVTALNNLAIQTEHPLLFDYNQVKDFQVNPLEGNYTLQQALDLILRDTGLAGSLTKRDVIAISLNPKSVTQTKETPMNIKGKTKGLVNTAASAVLLTAVSAAPAQAQETDAPKATVFDEIIVTAQKREEGITEVPVALTVLTPTQIENSNSPGLEGLSNLVPSLTLRKNNTVRNSGAFIRGIGTVTFSVVADPSVSTVVDGVVLSRSGQAFGDLYDLERIEVLRGPQGTLFGKNASAGVINLTTKGATDEFEGNVNLSYFQGGEARAKASISGPITDRLKGRLTGSFGQYDGPDRNIFDANPNDTEPGTERPGGLDDEVFDNSIRVNGYRRAGIRGILEYEATDNLDLKLIGEYYEANDTCCAQIVTPANPDGTPNVEAIANNRDVSIDNDFITRNLNENYSASLQADWDLGHHTLTSISAFRQFRDIEIADGDGTSSVDFVREGSFTGLGSFRQAAAGDQTVNQYSQEFRLASEFGGPLQYQLGAFYWNVNNDRTFSRASTTCIDTTLPTLANGQRPCAIGQSTFQDVAATADITAGFESLAFFGQGTYDLTDRLTLIAGLRFTHDVVEFTHERINPSMLGAPGIRQEDFAAEDRTTNDEISGRAGLQYELSDNWQAYATYARGYKGPAFNVTFSLRESRLPVVGPENANSFEAGVKGTLFGGALYAALSAYHVEYLGFQASNFILVNGVTSSNLTNAGDVITKGLELDFIANITDDFTLSGGAALGSAEFSRINIVEGTETENRNIAEGQNVSFAPDFRASISANYYKELENLPFNFKANSSFSYTGEQFSNLGERAREFLDERFVWDATVGITNKDETLGLDFIVKNILDDEYATNSRQSAGSLFTIIPREANRYVGVKLSAGF